MKCTINQSLRHTHAHWPSIRVNVCTINFPLLNVSARRHRRNNTPVTAQTEEHVAFIFILDRITSVCLSVPSNKIFPINAHGKSNAGNCCSMCIDQTWPTIPPRGSRYIGCLNLSTSSSSSTFFMAVEERLHSSRRLRNYSNTSDATRDVVSIFADNTERHFLCWWPLPLPCHYLSVPEISSISYPFSITSIALPVKGGRSCSDSNLGVKSSSAGPPRDYSRDVKQQAPLALMQY